MATSPRQWPTDVPAMIRNLARGRQEFTSNAFLVTGATTTLVDVGNDFDVVAAAREVVDDVDSVVLTHSHFDHVGNLGSVREAFDPEVRAFDEAVGGIDHTFDEGATVQIGDHDYLAVHTPGHKDDHVCLYAAEPSVLFAGDLVFANGSFGRTDLDEGDRPTLIESIRRVLDVVDEDLSELHTGHGPSVTTDAYRNVELALQAART